MNVIFEETQFNRIFPFYILINNDLVINSVGKTLEKMIPGMAGKSFHNIFSIKRPEIVNIDFESLQNITNQLVIIEVTTAKHTVLRGQLELLPATKQILFIGSPWFGSMEKVVQNNLKIDDFAFHDPMIDLLHVLKTQEITTDDLKQLLTTVNKQKNDLKNAAKEIHDIALFPMQNPDPLIRIDREGKILKLNPAAVLLTDFIYDDIKYSQVDFWIKISAMLNINVDREVIEASSGGKTYSFVIKPLPEDGYYNIYGRDITEQKKNEEQLKLLALVASTNENGVFFTNTRGAVFYANQAYCTLTGYSLDEIIGHTPMELGLSSANDNANADLMRNAFSTGQNFHFEIPHYRKDGSWFWSRCKGQPNLDTEGRVMHYFTIIEDITLEKENENQLNILSSIAAQNTHGVVISDKDGKIEWANKSFERMTGYALSEMVGKKPGLILQGSETNPETIAYLRNQIHAGEPFVCEILNYHRSGKPYWLRIQGQAIKDKEGRVIKYFAIEEDITREKETQQKLKDFESRFRLALEKIGDNVWEYDFVSNKTVFSNPEKNFLGYNFSENTDNVRLWWNSIHKDDLHLMIENDRKCRYGEIDFHILEYRMIDKDGSIRWVLDRGVVIEKDMDGKPLKIIGTHTNITDQKIAEEALRIKEEKYRNIITNMNLGLLEVDIEEKIQYANQRFCIMSGYELHDLIGKKASNLFVTPESRDLLEQKNESRKNNIADAYEVSVTDKNGQLRWWLISGAPNYNDQGKLIGSIGIHLDVTEQKNLELELIEAKNFAEASTRAKEIFLANMSHEIRTPMNAIIGMSNQLAKTSLSHNQEFYLHTIQSAADNLLVIINDILDLSKIEAGKLALENIGFDPRQLADSVMRVMMYKAEEKGIAFTTSHIDNKLSPVLIGDPFRLNQVLLNLLSNAIKFTEKGSVDVSFQVAGDTPETQTLVIKVQDTGIGMDETFVKQIFDKFSQEYKSVSRTYGGTGLGMSIAKDLIELMGGKIEVVSKKEKGTTISFTVEFHKGDISDILQKEAFNITNNFLAGKKIVVADDNDHNRLVASIILGNYGAEISEAVNGEEAIRTIQQVNADLVLMDIQMPVLNGLQATRQLREQGIEIPVIAVTANAIKGENQKCLDAGMNDYISKPFKEDEFLKTIARWLKTEVVSEEISAGISESHAESSDPLFDISSLKEISRGNEAFILKMVKLFCDQTPLMFDEMISAFEKNDLETMGAIAHKIKPSIDTFNIIPVKHDIRTIEAARNGKIPQQDLQNLLGQTRINLDKVISELKKQFQG